MKRFKHVLRMLCGWKYASTKFSGNWIIYSFWLIAAILLIAQPIVLTWEFRDWGPNRWTLMKLYPHQLLIPPMCFVFVFWAYGAAVSRVWAHQRQFRRRIIMSVGIACGATAIYLPFELTRSPVMLLELKPNATWRDRNPADPTGSSTINTQMLTAHYLDLALMNRGYATESDSESNPDQTTRLEKKVEFKRQLRGALNYDAWKGRGNWSITRWLYATTFFLGIAGAFNAFFALTFVPSKRPDRTQFIFKIMYCFGGYGLWVAARFYFNYQIKAPVFGLPYKYPPWDTVLWAALVFAIVRLTLVWLPKNWKAMSIPIMVATSLPALLGLLAPESLDGIIGVTSEPSAWFVTFTAICILTYWLGSLTSSRPMRGGEILPS